MVIFRPFLTQNSVFRRILIKIDQKCPPLKGDSVELAHYLDYLSKNDTAYKEHQIWWTDKDIEDCTYPKFNENDNRICKLCKILTENQYKKPETYKSYTGKDLWNWFYWNNTCYAGSFQEVSWARRNNKSLAVIENMALKVPV